MILGLLININCLESIFVKFKQNLEKFNQISGMNLLRNRCFRFNPTRNTNCLQENRNCLFSFEELKGRLFASFCQVFCLYSFPTHFSLLRFSISFTLLPLLRFFLLLFRNGLRVQKLLLKK